MSWDFYVGKKVKTRKVHSCVFCDRNIPIGSNNILHYSGKFEGEMQSSYACNWCESNSYRLVDDDRYISDFWDSIREDIFYDKLKELKKTYDDIEMKFDGDFLIFYNDTGELHREYMPISEEVKGNKL